MLSSYLMNQLSMIQLSVASVNAIAYDAPLANMTCAGGPTNCQNQW